MKKKICLLGGLFLFGVTSLWSNPQDSTLISGSGFSVSYPDAYTCEISASSTRTIVDWDTFSIGPGQTTTITLPSSNAVILNRVTSEEAISYIQGNLTCNGQVYLINASGVLISTDGEIDVAAFLASSLDADNSEFLNAGEMTFVGTENAEIFVLNAGTITASEENVFLLSYQVVNSSGAVINAENGTVVQAAGVEMLLSPSSEQKIAILPQTPLLSPLATGIDDAGTINSITAELKAQGSLYATAINHSGWITTQSATSSHIRAQADCGLVQANGIMTSVNGNQGGLIDVMGKDITFSSTTVLDVSAVAGTGVINVGQDISGTNPDFVLAETVDFSAGYFNSSADYNGEGGQVTIRASNAISVYGSVDATGGLQGGNGGLVFFSTNGSYTFGGNVDVSAPSGDPGLFLHP